MEPLNSLDLELLRRALSQPEMARWADQVVTICHKLGLPAPSWTEPRPAAPEPRYGS